MSSEAQLFDAARVAETAREGHVVHVGDQRAGRLMPRFRDVARLTSGSRESQNEVVTLVVRAELADLTERWRGRAGGQ